MYLLIIALLSPYALVPAIVWLPSVLNYWQDSNEYSDATDFQVETVVFIVIVFAMGPGK